MPPEAIKQPLSIILLTIYFVAVFRTLIAVDLYMLVYLILINRREVARLVLVDLLVIKGVYILGGS